MVVWFIPNSLSVSGFLINGPQRQNQKSHPFRLVELGPGRGTLMDGILQVKKKVTKFIYF
jgi:SAM-dependent MidA family methyltransferase